MNKMNLPMGEQSFKNLRNRGMYYVDKTPLIYELIDRSCYYFLSRPRRFGKSLLIDTIKCLFEGRKELFEGLAIYNKWNWEENKHPVVRISFDGKAQNPEAIERSLLKQLSLVEKSYRLNVPSPPDPTAPERLRDVLYRLHEETGKEVVVLIDEYDNPILSQITNGEQAKASSDYLKDFYGTLKGCQSDIRFEFITGISLFSKVNLFTVLNNLTDISLDPRYSTLCGYTDQDIDTVFAPELKGLDREKIRKWYNGYSWLGTEKVYNPHSILNLFDQRVFRDWWSDQSVPEYLYQILLEKQVTPVEISRRITDRALMSRFEVSTIKIDSLLFQSGYLTIVEGPIVDEIDDGEFLYGLGFPNHEITQSFNKNFIRHIQDVGLLGFEIHFKSEGKALLSYLVAGEFQHFKDRLFLLLKKTPHPWYDSSKTLSRLECWYASVVYWSFVALGLSPRVEEISNLGRCDMVVEYEDQVFVMEFKMLSGTDVKRALKEGLAQIKEKDYAGAYRHQGKTLHLISLVFDNKSRNISDVLAETIK